MSKRRKISRATRERLRKLRQKFRLGEYRLTRGKKQKELDKQKGRKSGFLVLRQGGTPLNISATWTGNPLATLWRISWGRNSPLDRAARLVGREGGRRLLIRELKAISGVNVGPVSIDPRRVFENE